jgi:hypothetical protein
MDLGIIIFLAAIVVICDRLEKKWSKDDEFK